MAEDGSRNRPASLSVVEKESMPTSPRVSVIIATYNREGVLCDTIGQVLSEQYDNKEVVIIDQTVEHELATRNYLESVSARIRYIRMDHPSVTEAENIGIKAATGEILLFVDDDVNFEPGFIAAHVRNYVDPAVWGVAGQVLEIGHRPKTRLAGVCSAARFGYFFFRHDYAYRARVPNIPEGNASFRRQALLDVGLFDESYRENGYLFGMDLSLRVAKAGGRIVHDPAATLLHLRARSGGVRMKAVRPLSYFGNLFRFLRRHHGRHERFAIALRVFFYRVLAEGWRRPWVIPANTRTFVRAWWKESR